MDDHVQPPSGRSPAVYYGWWIVAVAFLTQCVGAGIGFSSMGVFLSVLTEALGWTRTQVSWGISLLALGAVVYAPAVGRFVDRFGPRWVQLIGAVVTAAGFVLLGRMETKPQFYLLMGTVSLGVAALWVPGAIAVANWFVRQRGRAMGISIAGTSLGPFIFVPLTQLLVARFGWRNAFALLGVSVAILVTPPVAALMVRRPEDLGLRPDGDVDVGPSIPVLGLDGEFSLTPHEALRQGNFWLITTAFALIAMAVTGMLMHEISILRDRGIAASTAALVLGATAGAGVPGKIGFGYLLDSFGPRLIVAACFGLQAIGTMLLLMPLGPMMLAFFVAMYGVAAGGTGTLLAGLVGRCFGRLHYGAIYGRMTSFTVIGNAIGAPLLGIIRDKMGHYTPGLLLIMFTDVVAILCVAGLQVPASQRASGRECHGLNSTLEPSEESATNLS